MKSGSAYLLAVFIWLAALPTCHSTGNPTAPADGSGGGGAGGTDGAAPDRFSGTDGAVPDRSSGSDGGTADRSGVPDAIDGAVAMTPTEICRAAVKAQAERVSVCEGYPLDERLRVANLCPDYFFNADSNRTVANVAACLGTLAAQTCTDIVLNFVPSCLSPGKRSAGAGCAYSSQCGSGMCGGTGEECSTCRAGGIPVGSPCRGGDCESGSFCHGGTRTCIEASTIVYATEGQACDLAATPVVGCVGDLLCLSGASVSTSGTCRPLPGAGQPCAVNNIGSLVCAAGTTCTNFGISGTDTCTLAICGSGPPCNDASYCAPGDGGFACVPLPTLGQPCNAVSAPCLSPAVCVGSTGRCAIPRASGEICDEDNPCADLLSCVAGTCQPLGSANCPAGAEDGGTG
jgi:hypothetical protein